jgi:hypothetical protein
MADITYSAEFNIITGRLKQGVTETQRGIKAVENSIDDAKDSLDGFNAGLKKGFAEAAGEATKLGANIAHSLTPALIGIQAGVKIISGLGGALKDAFMQNEHFARAIESLKNALGQSFAAAVAPAANFFGGLVGHIAQSIADANTLRKAFKLLKEDVSSAAIGDSTDDALKANLATLTAAQKVLQEKFDKNMKNQAWAASLFAQEAADEINKLDMERREIQKKLDRNEATRAGMAGLEEQRAAADAAEAEENRLAEARTNILNNQLDTLKRQAIERAKARGAIDEALRLEKELINTQRDREFGLLEKEEEYTEASLADQAKIRANFEAVTRGMISAVETRADAERKAAADRAAAELKALDEREKAEADAAERLEKDRATILDNQLDTLARQAIERAKAQGDTEAALRLEKDLIEAQRERERLLLLASDEYTKASIADQNKLMKNFNDVTEGMINAIGAVKEQAQGLTVQDKLAGVESEISDFAGNVNSILNSMVQTEIEYINALFEADMENLKKQRQLALEEAGLVKATTEENLQAALDAAEASGDEMTIYKEKRRQKELEINNDYDAQEKAREEQAAKERAELEYKAAMTEWTFNLLMAPVQVAQAVLKSYAEFGPVLGAVMSVLAKINGVAQIGAIMAAKPKKQYALGAAFDDGREVVTRPTNFNIGRMGEAGAEAIMPLTRMADGALGVASAGSAGNAGEHYTINVPLSLDGLVVANVMVDVINDGLTRKIDSRMVK